MAYTKYSLTPANNNAAPPDGAPEGMLPSAVNDTMRDMMSQIRDVGDGIRGGTYTMTAPVITGGSINNTTVGATTASTGAFTTLSATGVTTVQAGTVSLPAITTTGDTNTGIFFPAADTIAFTEGGVEAMRIDSSGNVGIGTNSPAAKLSVDSGTTTLTANFNSTNASGLYLRFQNSGTSIGDLGSGANVVSGGTAGDFAIGSRSGAMVLGAGSAERMRISSSGGVSIGNTSDAGAGNLSVSGNATAGLVGRNATYTNGSTTPSVTGFSFISIANSSPTTITNFTGGVTGQILVCYFNDDNTTINRNNAYLNGGNNFVSTSGDILTLVFNAPYWYEISRSNNA